MFETPGSAVSVRDDLCFDKVDLSSSSLHKHNRYLLNNVAAWTHQARQKSPRNRN